MPSSADVRFVGVPADRAADMWPMVREWIAGIAERSRGRMGERDYLTEIAGRDMQLWCAIRGVEVIAVAVTQIVQWPGRKVLAIVALSGAERDLWLGFEDMLAAWGREQGCSIMEAWTRPGWERVLTHWRKTHVLLERDLTDG